MCTVRHRNYGGRVGVISDQPDLSLPDSLQSLTNQAERRTRAWREGAIELFLKYSVAQGCGSVVERVPVSGRP